MSNKVLTLFLLIVNGRTGLPFIVKDIQRYIYFTYLAEQNNYWYRPALCTIL